MITWSRPRTISVSAGRPFDKSLAFFSVFGDKPRPSRRSAMDAFKFAGIFAVLSLAACGAPEVEDEVGSDEQELASTFTYHCRALHDAKTGELVKIRLGKTKAHVTLTAAGDDAELQALAGAYD